jgi:hypothetical protein
MARIFVVLMSDTRGWLSEKRWLANRGPWGEHVMMAQLNLTAVAPLPQHRITPDLRTGNANILGLWAGFDT